MRYVWATGTHQGRVRDHNEDSVYPQTSGSGEGPILVVVADGMGGHVAGEVASSTAIEHIAATEPGADMPAEDRVAGANDHLLSVVKETPSLFGMGTTMTLGVFHDDGVLEIGHVGDSRMYLYRDRELRLLTTDHTVVNELIALGHLDPDAADRHPQRHLLTRTLGLGPVAVDRYESQLQAGDRVLVCSDGLTTMVTDDGIAEIIADADVEHAVWSLIEAANSAGGIDNITVAVVDAVG